MFLIGLLCFFQTASSERTLLEQSQDPVLRQRHVQAVTANSHLQAQHARIIQAVNVDLHTHSRFSDGSDSVEEIVALAAENGIDVLAFVDHDQLADYSAAKALGERLGVRVVAGTEISAEWRHSDGEGYSKVHLLGYFTDSGPGSPLWALLASLRQKRDARNALILGKLALRTPPVVLQMEDVKAIATKKGFSPLTISRVHIAQLLVEKAFASGVKDAFNKYLSDDQLGLPVWSLPLHEAVFAVEAHGGVAVIAHPSTLIMDSAKFSFEMEALVASGVPVRGIECHNSRHTEVRYSRENPGCGCSAGWVVWFWCVLLVCACAADGVGKCVSECMRE